jgi:hypothetical protein
MATVQFICAKIGMVTGQGLAGVLRKHYSIRILYLAVFGSGRREHDQRWSRHRSYCGGDESVRATCLGVRHSGVAIDSSDPDLGSYIAAFFKWLTLSLLAYVGSAFFAHPDWLKYCGVHLRWCFSST